MQTELKVANDKLNNAEEWISDLEDRIMEVIWSEQKQKDKWKKNEGDSEG